MSCTWHPCRIRRRRGHRSGRGCRRWIDDDCDRHLEVVPLEVLTRSETISELGSSAPRTCSAISTAPHIVLTRWLRLRARSQQWQRRGSGACFAQLASLWAVSERMDDDEGKKKLCSSIDSFWRRCTFNCFVPGGFLCCLVLWFPLLSRGCWAFPQVQQ